jgi:hypothetical protein
MRLEDLPVIGAESDLHVEVVYLRRVDFPFLRWVRVSAKMRGYLTTDMVGGTPKKLSSWRRVPGGGYSHPCYIPLEDVINIRGLENGQ